MAKRVVVLTTVLYSCLVFRCLLQHINSIIAQNNLQQVAQRFAGELSDNELPLPQIPWMVKLDGSYIYFFQFKQTG